MAQSPNMPKTFAKTDRKAINRKEYTCIYCGRVFPSKYSLNWHLPHCKKRRVLRVFEVDGVVFYVYLNPRKDYMKALVRMQDEVKDAKKFMGALQLLVFHGIVMPNPIGKIILHETVADAKASGRYALLKKTPQQDAIREELLRDLKPVL